ncbi:hypothetical protein [Paenibacillus sp. NPDC058071]|uniref:hypothetical protein n=1 Tax=Paenibacillus sp. NPDC058071 TaxID=3346326 RepID=UPI0036D7BAE7
MIETLLIKHAVGGRTFVDSGKEPVAYLAQANGDVWTFAIEVTYGQTIEELLKWRKELNVFLFQTDETGERPVTKIWFYVNEDTVRYDLSGQRLTFEAKSRIVYVPDSFGYKL